METGTEIAGDSKTEKEKEARQRAQKRKIYYACTIEIVERELTAHTTTQKAIGKQKNGGKEMQEILHFLQKDMESLKTMNINLTREVKEIRKETSTVKLDGASQDRKH